MFECQHALETNGAPQRQDEVTQFALRLHIHRRGKEHEDATEDFREFKQTKQFRLGNRDRETAVEEIDNHCTEAGRPKPAAMTGTRQEQGTDQQADGQNIDERNFEAARGGAIPVASDKVNVHAVSKRAGEDQQEKGRGPRPLREASRHHPAGNRDGHQKQRGQIL